MPKKDALGHLSLGQQTEYPSQYDSSQLQAVPRSLNREPIGISGELPFSGVDQWTGYELSWLNAKGLPQVAIGYFEVPAASPNLVESKSFKLYLNSFNESRFDTWGDVQSIMKKDLSACAGDSVSVQLTPLSRVAHETIADFQGECIDSQDIDIEHYDYPLDKKSEGQMLFFPARLQHTVYPFLNCEEERVSISGNICLNN